jgi:hypothetical protein
MLNQRINPGDPERYFTLARAAEGSAMVKDQCVQFDVGTTIDGVRVVQPNTGELWAFIGVADQAIADTELGVIQVFGYRPTSLVFQTGTSQAAGAALAPVAAANYLASVATTVASNVTVTQQPIFAVLAESVASSAASTFVSAKIILRGI